MKNTKSHFSPEEREELSKKFKSQEPLYSRLSEEVVSILDFYFSKNESIGLAALTGRAKTLDSFLGKLDRKPYSRPFDEIEDFSGIRVVLYHVSDIPKVVEFLKEEMDVCRIDDKTEKLGVSRMGYSGTHIIGVLGKNYGKGIKLREICDLKFEIQVRTVLQDAWSTLSHSLFYKTTDALPDKIQRDFNNISALLEVADSGFDRIISEKNQLTKAAKRDVKKADFLTLSITSERIREYSYSQYKTLKVSDFWHERLMTDMIKTREFNTISDIDKAVKSAEGFIVYYQSQRPDLFKYSTDFLTKSLGFVSAEFEKLHPFADTTKEAFKQYRAKSSCQVESAGGQTTHDSA